MSNTNSESGFSPDDAGLSDFQSDFVASIVVFLVALPLCIGIAVAVGVSPARALITGIIGGIVVGFLAGSPLQVSGPAAGLFVIVADLLANAEAKYRSITDAATDEGAKAYALMVMGVCVFLAGAIQLIAGRLRLGQWFRAVSPAVIKGMLAGIGVLILVSQFHIMLDHDAMWHGEKAHGGLQYIATIPEAILKCFSSDTSENHHFAAATGILAIACFVLWPKFAPKKIQFIPAALVGILAATIFASLTGLEVQKLKVPDNMFDEITLPSSTWVDILGDYNTFIGAFVIALVASAETLLCATAVDQLHDGPRTKYDQELMAQGVGNVLCGLVGALPMTGVIVRSSANVSSGGKTRWATIIHGFWLLIFVAAIPFVLRYIPRSALGALLVYTGYRLINFKSIRSLWNFNRSEALIFLATVATIVSNDLLVGVIVGIVLSGIKLLVRFSDLDSALEVDEDESNAILKMRGAATFLNLPRLAAHLESVPSSATLHVDFEHLTYIDHACLDLLSNWAKQHGGELVMDWESLHGKFSTKKKTTK